MRDYTELYHKEKILMVHSYYQISGREDTVASKGGWKDLYTWNTLTEAIERAVVDVRFNENCKNVQVINMLGILILALGLRDVVIVAKPEGILIFDKEQSSYIKPYIDAIN